MASDVKKVDGVKKRHINLSKWRGFMAGHTLGILLSGVQLMDSSENGH